ncbi:LysR family transcriptional regulator [Saccharothrix syringae]|uniref:LysR family transcriptional regulator n=1 Tax=Saccharothrix syringae TaxID=103733 RepID=A0A5Q0H5J2_SACSY|nr:LysR family transcriptional regulator [Saccharothrix syringae]QFZ21511.1 LysR family transcriptional regulator [Saccharothrix syringae]
MDLDLAHVRAFVLVAGELHFGRAARRLAISQQALSKRIAALESRLGTRLLDRGGRGVRLTPAGERFLTPARQALTAGDAAVVAVRGEARPLRVDVWGHLYAPMRTLAALTGAPPLEPGHGRDLPSVAAALADHQVDAGFGRVHPPLPGDLTSRLVRVEPVDALVGADHPLARRDRVRPDELRDSALWTPAPLDRLHFLSRFADRFGTTRLTGGTNLGLDHVAAHVAADPGCFALLPADGPVPDHPGVRSIPLVDPTPLYAWSLLWRRDSPHPFLPALLDAFAEAARQRRWLEHDPGRDWLPDGDWVVERVGG